MLTALMSAEILAIVIFAGIVYNRLVFGGFSPPVFSIWMKPAETWIYTIFMISPTYGFQLDIGVGGSFYHFAIPDLSFLKEAHELGREPTCRDAFAAEWTPQVSWTVAEIVGRSGRKVGKDAAVKALVAFCRNHLEKKLRDILDDVIRQDESGESVAVR
jgi:hypothetical protein